MKIFTITHKKFTPPPDPLYVPLHVGHARFREEGLTDYGYMGDDTGEQISGKNNRYGELTGLYWVWKNCPGLDYAGLVHYRRYFADEQGKLLTEQDFKELFSRYDVIIGKHITYDVTYAEQFATYHHLADLDKTGAVIQALYPAYYETFQEVIHGKEQYVFNLFAAPKKLWDAYAKWLFDICFALEKVIDVSGYDQYRARIYGFLAEELLFVWIKKNQLSYYEAPVIYTQEKAETIEFKQAVRSRILTEGYPAAYAYFLETFQKRPDLTLEDADFHQELRILLAQLTHAVQYPAEAPGERFYAAQFERFAAADRVLGAVLAAPDQPVGEKELSRLAALGITKNMLLALIETHADYRAQSGRILAALTPAAPDGDFDAKMQALRAGEPVSVVILRCEDSTGADAAVADSVRSVQAQTGCTAECVVADAAGGGGAFCRGLCTGRFFVKYADISSGIYENMAQIKNAAVHTAAYDKAVLLPAGTVLQSGELSGLMSCGDVLAPECFETLFRTGIQGCGRMAVSRKQLAAAGGFNNALVTGEDLELLLRVCDSGHSSGFKILSAGVPNLPVYQETYQTYGYLLAKYMRRLKAEQLFDAVFTARYEEAVQYGIQEDFVQNMERQLSDPQAFNRIDCNVRPVLVVFGEGLCYGVLDAFARAFARALGECGVGVRLFDLQKEPGGLAQAAGVCPYRAVVGFQTGAFAKQLPDGRLVGNLFDCPKFNFIFDHPLYISYYLMVPLQDFYVLAQDGDYAAYVKQYLTTVRGAWHVPPAGVPGLLAQAAEGKGQSPVTAVPKKYGLSFIGTYHDYRARLRMIREMAAPKRRLAVRLLRKLRRDPSLPVEEAFQAVLSEAGCGGLSGREFAVRLHRMREASRAVMFYYREKIIGYLLDAGIELHVFSDSWKDSPFAGHPRFRIHETVSYAESLDVMAQSRLSLNLMSWHKNGMTERVANAMRNGSVCISDRTVYLSERFEDGRELILFDLQNPGGLVQRLKPLLSGDGGPQVQALAQAGYAAAKKNHRWQNRAEAFITIMKQIEEDRGN